MKEEVSLKEIIRYWTEKAEDSLNAAKDELEAGRLSFSVNRIYYTFMQSVPFYFKRDLN